jgi:hypothetical protein
MLLVTDTKSAELAVHYRSRKEQEAFRNSSLMSDQEKYAKESFFYSPFLSLSVV